jgi:hypothetical protein
MECVQALMRAISTNDQVQLQITACMPSRACVRSMLVVLGHAREISVRLLHLLAGIAGKPQGVSIARVRVQECRVWRLATNGKDRGENCVLHTPWKPFKNAYTCRELRFSNVRRRLKGIHAHVYQVGYSHANRSTGTTQMMHRFESTVDALDVEADVTDFIQQNTSESECVEMQEQVWSCVLLFSRR